MRSLLRSAFVLGLASILSFLSVRTALAAGVVTDCTTYGPGPGTLAEAVAGGGLVTFECSGTIVFPSQIKLRDLPGERLVVDGSGQRVVFSGGGVTRLFNVGPDSSLHLHRVTLTAGNAGISGGGAIQSSGQLTITQSALLSNTAAYGGAIELYNGSATIRNSTLAGNRALDTDPASGGGGAIDQYFTDQGDGNTANESPDVLIINSTIVNNQAAIGTRSGIWQENGRLQIRYSIVAGNGTRNCLIAPPNTLQYAIVGSLDNDGSCLASLRGNPLLGALGGGGGSTPVYPLLPASPAIDAVAADVCAGSVDQRGSLRPRDGNHDGVPGCDIGAYEVADRFVVLAAADEGLAGYWKFDEGSGGTSVDSSGHALTATLHSGAGFAAGASRLRFGSPFALRGSATAGAQVADAPGLSGGNELTVAAWVRLDNSSGLQQILTKMQNSETGPGYGLFVREGFLSGEAWDSTGARHVITSEVIAGGWLHVAMTYQADGEQRLYLNGSNVGTQAVTGALAANPAPLIMAVAGAIDDVRVYSRTLSAGAVAALANGRGCVTPGSTWGDAVPDLQCALLEALPGAEVWIGPGIYRPTRGPDRTATFAIGDGVGVYGGFAGGESTREQRSPQTPQPVLSGDIGADDRVDAGGVLTDAAGLAGGNAFHVVSISSTLTSTLLQDVTITGGQADGAIGAACANGCGGGLAVAGGAPQLSRLRLIGNRALAWGGALYAEQSSTRLISSTLEANQADSGGGAFWQGGAPLIANSLVAGNLALKDGGGFYASNSSLRLVNVTVAGNRAGSQGGGLLTNGGASSASNLLVAANAAPTASQAGGNGVTLQRSLLQGGCPATFVCGSDVLTGDPLLAAAYPISAPVSSGDYHLLPASPAIDSGDNGASLGPGAPAGMTTIAALANDVDGAPRITAARVLPPQIDLGAYEAPNTPPVFVSSPITWGTTTIEYLYEVVAVDPNVPDQYLPVNATATPPWLALEQEQNRPAHLHGTPGEIWYGYFDVRLQTADSLGATTEQKFTICVLVRVYWLYLAHLAR